jgi:hypothetical protein
VINRSVEAESRGYLEYYGQLRQAALSDEELFNAMVDRYPDWVSRQQFLILGILSQMEVPLIGIHSAPLIAAPAALASNCRRSSRTRLLPRCRAANSEELGTGALRQSPGVT